MRSAHAVAILLSMLGGGVAGWLARGHSIATPPIDAPSPAGEPTPRSNRGPVEASVEPSPRLAAAAIDSRSVEPTPRLDAGAIESRPADLARHLEALAAEVGALRREDSTRWAALASDLEALKARMAGMASTQEALAKKAGVPLPWPSDPAEVEKVRDRWRSNLEETEKMLRAIYPQGPSLSDVVVWSRYDDHQRAKAALEAATDSASLRALSEGAFRSYFTMTR